MTVAVVTKLQTSNLGNLALSTELLRHVRAHAGEVVAFDRPMQLAAFGLNWLERQRDPVRSVDIVAQVLRHLPRGASQIRPPGESPRFVGVAEATSRPRPAVMKAVGRALRPLLPAFQRRWATLRSSRIVYYAGAGAITDHDALVQLLIEMRALQLSRVTVVPVCQSVIVTRPALRRVLGEVYGMMPDIFVRGPSSAESLIAMGVRPDRVHLAADFVWWSGAFEPRMELERSGVGLSLTSPVMRDLGAAGLRPFLEKLRSVDSKLVGISSDQGQDSEIIDTLARHESVERQDVIGDAHAYTRALSGFRIVVTARFHTAVMALLAGVPTVALSGTIDQRASETFARLGYPVPVVRTNEPGVMDRLNHALSVAASLQYRDTRAVIERARAEAISQLAALDVARGPGFIEAGKA